MIALIPPPAHESADFARGWWQEQAKTIAAEAARYEAEQVQADAPIVACREKSIQTASGSTGAIRDFEIVVENKAVFFQEVVVARGMFGLVEIKPGPLKDFAKMQRVGDKLPSIPGCKVSEKFRFAGRGRNGA